ncbi:MAG: Glycosyl transferase family 2 [Candidatus Curtissbacteria bacterium GW2011_GWA1_40_47]|uniref:Glycosyltransferase 2-like domain-containing protein n=1 Tax=Candidatus Curtissbacteria bacterium RIFOXYA1_FULL_41_14 TaxID=1797737 RepID=A0A1F5HAP8_9BACT|nr:MAG: Glycosyl transferase family 2 [Candidatus Curtissbacteria bacterium GW2011_GWB1_40_28]KKR62406.1 MAG: Glycosyl transferase family 2 [Microgenomates group bacterium GW2011_GWC1_40_35]KKR66393.1 MAG: Glycosyl transferase family 2 [Candidatus Curtissbacteria bacterium GW2011_GWA1_40_47]KKR77768.1 MAG: Glycosyl transferase family 2 [Candidatus Curtissbacteria bacterium GW2011_GWD1_40_8]KKS02574.1 MAG: Glycosyl transferase family 2 [Candidatus Curtissbacteria bacterium GW2011_GWC2_41_21]OGD
MDLSVIIVNWNTKRLLEDCLESIYRYTNNDRSLADARDDEKRGKNISFEVIVADNGSTDGSQTMVKEKFPKAKLILNKANLGFTKANNQGIKIAKGEYILLLNSDTYLIENSLEKLLDKARSIRGDLGAIGPLLLNEDRSIQQSVGFFPHLPQVFWWMSFIDDLPGGTLLKPYHVDHDSFYRKDQKVDWVTGAAILVPRDVITKVDSLDEKIFMYGEEVEWCWRIKNAGHKIYFTPTTKIIHIGRGSSRKIPTSAFIGEYKAVLYFYQKYKGKFSLQIVRLLLKIGALARIIVFGLLGRKELAKSYVEAFKAV